MYDDTVAGAGKAPDRTKGEMEMKKVLALVLALALAVCAVVALAEEAKVLTHEEYINYVAPETDEEVAPITIETYVQAHQSWWDNKVSVYAQSEDGAYFIYNMTCSEEDAAKLVPGAKIRVTGYKTEWQGEVEIQEGATFEFVEADPFVAEAEDLTEVLGTDDLINHQNEFFTAKGLTVAPSKIEGDDKEYAFLYGWDGSGTREDNGGVGADLYFNVELNGNIYNFTVESYLCGADSDVYKTVEGLQVGDKIDVEGFLYWYNAANPHIVKVTKAE